MANASSPFSNSIKSAIIKEKPILPIDLIDTNMEEINNSKLCSKFMI